jgi:hypothetical protein
MAVIADRATTSRTSVVSSQSNHKISRVIRVPAEVSTNQGLVAANFYSRSRVQMEQQCMMTDKSSDNDSAAAAVVDLTNVPSPILQVFNSKPLLLTMCVFERSDIDGKDRSIANSHEQFP